MKYLYLLLTICFFFSFASNAQEAKDSITTFQLKDVVVSASRIQEDIRQTPVSIEKISESVIRQTTAPSFFDGLENVKGVQMITPSLGFRVINTRGFANTTNVRFVQMADGMDQQAPHIGAPIGQALAPGDLDIQSVEIVPGVASALYGMNAINGMANFISKDPFKSPGLSVQQKTGMNRLNTNAASSVFSETSFRWAQVVHPKLAFKVNGTFTRGTDWIADDQTDLNPTANLSTGLKGADNPAFDGVNSYGNESFDRRTVTLNGKNYVVARTGYRERDMVDYGIRNLKTDAAIHYKILPGVTISYLYRYSILNNVYQRANRFRLEDYVLQQHGFTLQSPSIILRTYLNVENTGNSYNARSMGENIDRTFKPDNQWYTDYSNAFSQAVGAQPVATAQHLARLAADAGRPQPGTETFNNLIGQLRKINNWDIGAALRVRSRMFHAEGQINLTQKLIRPLYNKTGIELLAGFDHRNYLIIPDFNYFINPVDPTKNLIYYKTGGFLQATKSLFSEKVKLGVTIRADKNQYFDLKWNPRVTIVYTPDGSHAFRASFQAGYRFPSIFEAFSNVNSGGVKRVGGLPVMSHGVFENAWLRSSVDAFQSAINNDVNTKGLTKNQAIIQEQNLLTKNTYTYLQPEHISSIEIGYRGTFLKGDLQIDADFYYNRYDQFIAQLEMNIPKTTITDSIPFYLSNKNLQSRYRMWTNSKTTAYNYGSTVGLRYRLFKQIIISGNSTYSQLDHQTTNDGLEDGFNTPQWMFNAGLGSVQIYKSLGFQINYRWQSTYYWQSFLVNGNTPSYQTVDAQVSLKWNQLRIKLGGTNIFNQYYRSFLGGPSVGGLYYSSVTFGI